MYPALKLMMDMEKASRKLNMRLRFVSSSSAIFGQETVLMLFDMYCPMMYLMVSYLALNGAHKYLHEQISADRQINGAGVGPIRINTGGICPACRV